MRSIFLISAISLMLDCSAPSIAKSTFYGVSKSNKLSTEQTLLRGPYLQCATSNSIIIRWRTVVPMIGKVKYGTTLTQLNKEAIETKPATEHIVKVEGLQPETKYYYSINGDSKKLQGDKDNFFTTLPVAGKEGVYRVGIFGDPGSLTTLQVDVRDQFLKYLGDKPMNAWVALGDIAYDHGWDAEYQVKFFNIYKDKLLKSYPLFTLPGNHDYGDQDSITFFTHNKIDYYKTFSMPVNGESGGVPSHNQAYYSFDVGNIHFLMLDSFGEQDSTTLADTTGPQVQWIKKDLEANKNKGWVIALWHHPPYSMGSHNSDEQSDMYKIRQNFLPLLERYNIDLVICGHSHLYERSKLMAGHFGKEATFNSDNVISNSSGLYDGSANSCPYTKDAHNNRGVVYIVNGGSSEVGGAQKNFPHNAMYYSNNVYGGTNMLEVQGNRLDMKWITEDGTIRDRFTMMKNVNKKSIVHLKKGESTTLTASFVGDYEWNDNKTTRSISVTPMVNTTYTVKDKQGCILDTFEVTVLQ